MLGGADGVDGVGGVDMLWFGRRLGGGHLVTEGEQKFSVFDSHATHLPVHTSPLHALYTTVWLAFKKNMQHVRPLGCDT